MMAKDESLRWIIEAKNESSWWCKKRNHWNPKCIGIGMNHPDQCIKCIGIIQFHDDESSRFLFSPCVLQCIGIIQKHRFAFLSLYPPDLSRENPEVDAKMLLLMMRVCWRALTSVDLSWCTLMCADVRHSIQHTAYKLQLTTYNIQRWCVYLCWCTLMCADVCSSSCLCLICRGNLELCQDAAATAASAPILRPPLAGVASARVRWWSRRGHLRYHQQTRQWDMWWETRVSVPRCRTRRGHLRYHRHKKYIHTHLLHQHTSTYINNSVRASQVPWTKKMGIDTKEPSMTFRNVSMHEKRPVTKTEWLACVACSNT